MGSAKKNPAFKPFQINLLVRKGEQLKTPERLIKWVLSSGRFIVVLVELVTIGAFVGRYKLDAELADLQEQIKEKVPYIESLRADETLIRQTQFQISTIKQTKNESPDFVQTVSKIASLTPKNIRIANIALDQTQSFPKTLFTISGTTPSNIELSVFISALQKDPTFADVTLTNISFEGQTVFTLTGSLTKKGVKSS